MNTNRPSSGIRASHSSLRPSVTFRTASRKPRKRRMDKPSITSASPSRTARTTRARPITTLRSRWPVRHASTRTKRASIRRSRRSERGWQRARTRRPFAMDSAILRRQRRASCTAAPRQRWTCHRGFGAARCPRRPESLEPGSAAEALPQDRLEHPEGCLADLREAVGVLRAPAHGARRSARESRSCAFPGGSPHKSSRVRRRARPRSSRLASISRSRPRSHGKCSPHR